MEQVLKVDKDSPDRHLFDRFRAKLNSSDEISLRISSESRGLGKGGLYFVIVSLYVFFKRMLVRYCIYNNYRAFLEKASEAMSHRFLTT